LKKNGFQIKDEEKFDDEPEVSLPHPMLTIEFWQDNLIFSPSTFTYHIFKAYIILVSYISSIIYAAFAAFRFDVEGEHLQHEDNKMLHAGDRLIK
jgi:hypothetical protein